MLKWLYENWMKATPFLAFYSFILVFLYVKDVNYPLYLIWLQGIVYWVHEFEEYINHLYENYEDSTKYIEDNMKLTDKRKDTKMIEEKNDDDQVDIN